MRLVERLVYPLARRWIAGESLAHAIERARRSNSEGMGAIINFLGENEETGEGVAETVQEYVRLLREIREKGVRGCISVKPSHIGLKISRELCWESLRAIVQEARSLGLFVWLDMEGSQFTQDTIDLYVGAHRAYAEMGLAVQANLRRTWEDVERLLSERARIRLCKGAYNEPRNIAFKTKREVDANFSKIMARLFEKGRGFGIATHDHKLIEEAIQISKISHRDFEFQMLIGIRDDLKPGLIADGYAVSDYIPYGKSWLPYSIRRIRERKRNLLLLLRSF